MTDERTVVILPGRSFGPYAPQLFFPMMAAVRRGAVPRVVTWRNVESIGEIPVAELPGWVADQIDIAGLDPQNTLVVGKSLGSYAADVVADLGSPAIWVTPVLISDEIVRALERARSPFLLAGGTADDLWDSVRARRLTQHVVEIPNGDHGLFVPGPLDRSASSIGTLAAACESFIDSVVWPSGAIDQAAC